MRDRTIVSFAGAHGSGKTTLAQMVTETSGVPFFPSQAAAIHRRFGVTASDQLPFALRLEIQRAILQTYAADYETARRTGGVFDRTPLDFAAYTLADAGRGLDAATAAAAEAYVADCLTFSGGLKNVLLCAPLMVKLEARGSDKPDVDNLVYARHIDLLVRGLVHDAGVRFMVVAPGSLGDRVDAVARFLHDEFNRSADDTAGRRQRGAHGLQ